MVLTQSLSWDEEAADPSTATDRATDERSTTATTKTRLRLLRDTRPVRAKSAGSNDVADSAPGRCWSNVDADETPSPSERPTIEPVVLHPPPLPKSTFEARQLWEGVVEEVKASKNELLVTLRDLWNRSNGPERAVISLDEVADADRDLVAPGAIFYWSIGYERTIRGQKRSVAEIRFRRLPSWTRSELAQIQREAEEMASRFATNSPNT
jgi:hypothetical protein